MLQKLKKKYCILLGTFKDFKSRIIFILAITVLLNILYISHDYKKAVIGKDIKTSTFWKLHSLSCCIFVGEK